MIRDLKFAYFGIFTQEWLTDTGWIWYNIKWNVINATCVRIKIILYYRVGCGKFAEFISETRKEYY